MIKKRNIEILHNIIKLYYYYYFKNEKLTQILYYAFKLFFFLKKKKYSIFNYEIDILWY